MSCIFPSYNLSSCFIDERFRIITCLQPDASYMLFLSYLVDDNTLLVFVLECTTCVRAKLLVSWWLTW